MIYNVMLVSGVQQSDSIICIYLCICAFRFFSHVGYYKIECSSLCYTVGPCCLSILYIVVCVFIWFSCPTKYYSCFDFFQPSKNIKTNLSLPGCNEKGGRHLVREAVEGWLPAIYIKKLSFQYKHMNVVFYFLFSALRLHNQDV